MKRRDFLSSLAVLGASAPLVNAKEVSGGQPWEPGAVSTPPSPPRQGGRQYLTQHEFDTVAIIAERFIPHDEMSISGKEAGCAIFIDRQLAGDFGQATALYRLGRFVQGTPEQGPQFVHTPAERYRLGLAALDKAVQQRYQTDFISLTAAQQDAVLHAMEANDFPLGSGIDTQAFFELLLQNVREGFLSDPLYGGNKGMASWKMIGFPGARYDFRDLLDKKG